MTREITVPEGAAGERLDLFLAGALEYTRSRVQHLVRAELVRVNDQSARPGYALRTGDHIAVEQPDAATVAPAPAPDLAVVYEDANLLVIDKPAGIAVHPGAGPAIVPGDSESARPSTVADFARSHTTDATDPERPGIVHRLDRDTSGLLIIARTPAAKAALQREFAGRRVRKTYLLLIIGTPKPDEAIIRLPLGRDATHPLRQAVVQGGREAETHYRTLATFPGYALVEAHPTTGRTHQLRVHFAAIGHPVAGDVIYGPPQRPLGLQHQFLHATRLEFTTPTGRHLSLESPLPPDLAAILERLGWNRV